MVKGEGAAQQGGREGSLQAETVSITGVAQRRCQQRRRLSWMLATTRSQSIFMLLHAILVGKGRAHIIMIDRDQRLGVSVETCMRTAGTLIRALTVALQCAKPERELEVKHELRVEGE